MFLIGLPIKGAKVCYKYYKQNKAEKGLRERGIPHAILDPSYEFEAVAPPNSYDTPPQSDKSLGPYYGTGAARHRKSIDSSSSSSSLNSTSTAELEAQLEHDADFQRFMKQQRQAYVEQHWSARQGLAPETWDHAQPPSYEVLMARATSGHDNDGKDRYHASPVSSVPSTSYELPGEKDRTSSVRRTREQRMVELQAQSITSVPTRAVELPSRHSTAAELPAESM